MLDREEDQFRRTLRTGLTILDTELDRLDAGGTVGRRSCSSCTTPTASRSRSPPRSPAIGATRSTPRRSTRPWPSSVAGSASRARRGGGGDQTEQYAAVLAEHGPTTFTGRDENESKATVLAVVPGAEATRSASSSTARPSTRSRAARWATPAPSTPTGTAEVLDTTYARPACTSTGQGSSRARSRPAREATATIDGVRRDAIRRNHTGTHILHWALGQVLGDHVKQQGSLVAPDRLRFDFSHFEPVTPRADPAIEDLANHEILDNAPVRHFETTMAEAAALGAIAFFGEKYGDIVRVLEAGRHSTELCGGTHVKALGDIGPLKIVSEGSIGSNLRRIEAITGTGPIERLRQEEEQLDKAAELVGSHPPSCSTASPSGSRRAQDPPRRDQGAATPGGREPGPVPWRARRSTASWWPGRRGRLATTSATWRWPGPPRDRGGGGGGSRPRWRRRPRGGGHPGRRPRRRRPDRRSGEDRRRWRRQGARPRGSRAGTPSRSHEALDQARCGRPAVPRGEAGGEVAGEGLLPPEMSRASPSTSAPAGSAWRCPTAPGPWPRPTTCSRA